MTAPKHFLSLTVQLTEEQLGFLDYLYPNDDPEDALVKLLDRARNRAFRKAEQQVRILHPHEERLGTPLEEPVSQASDEFVNPIGALQELCQKQRISLPSYEFEELSEGFRCKVQAMGLSAKGEGLSKKDAKAEAARRLLEGVFRKGK